MKRTTNKPKGVLPISIKLDGTAGNFYFKHWRGFKKFMKGAIKDELGAINFLEWLAESEALNKCVYFEAKRGTSDKLPTILKKALKNPIEL